jgi:hypothetical protein
VLGVSLLRSCQAAHARLRNLLDRDQLCVEVGRGFGPNGLVERVRVGKIGVGATKGQASVLARRGNRMDIPQGDIMLKDVVATKVGEVEAAGEGVLRACSNGLREKKKSIRVLDVVAAEHAVGKRVVVEVLAVPREVAMVGQSVEARTRTTSFAERLV